MKGNISRWLGLLVLLSMLLTLAPAALASPPYPEGQPDTELPPVDIGLRPAVRGTKSVDQPNIKDYLRNRERQRLMEAGLLPDVGALSLESHDRVLVILVEFAGTDVFTWEAGVSTWDPYGRADPDEAVYDEDDNLIIGDCSNIINETTTFTYTGPLHNELPRPVSADDRSGDSIWTEDFSPGWFEAFLWGDGVVFDYVREDGSVVHEDFTGQSVKDYFLDMSGGAYELSGDVVGWLQVPHSTWWYDADECPGARSGGGSRGAIPGAGSSRTLVEDALAAVNAAYPDFPWADYDLDGDGVIDRLWLVHAGYGEEDSTTLLNRTDYGEAAVWSHSSSGGALEVAPGIDIVAGPYIWMPENGGIGVFAHEAGHNLGADDLYAYGDGETSAGFWALQADSWTGYPIGFEPPAADPWHLDNWGWLDPFIIDDMSQSYEVTIGQASRFPGGDGVYRGVKIPLPDGTLELAVPVWQGEIYWWGGKEDLANAMMTTVDTVAIPAGGGSLSFDLVYDIEDEWDFLWIQASEDGSTWDTLTNENTQCEHDVGWIGEINGFPEDLCGAGLGGFYGYNENWPDPETQVFDLSAYADSSIYLRFWFMTDWGTTYTGAFVDNVAVTADGSTIFVDDAEMGDAKWSYEEPWQRSDGTQAFTHNYYLQWRNVGENGGYDSAMGDPRWRFGPANSGLLVWYNNNFYTDNEIYNYVGDAYGFGPKGRMLVVDSHSYPYRNPALQGNWLGQEHTNLTTRGQMRDAPFTIQDTVGFWYNGTWYDGRPAAPNFHDYMSYYPGVANEGDGTYWSTVDWDASVALPALGSYSVAGGADYPGFHIQYVDGAGWFGFWEAGQGGTGNPGDDGVQFGVNVCLKDQAADDSWGRVYVTSAKFGAGSAVVGSTQEVLPGDEIEFAVLPQNLGGEGEFFTFVPLNDIPGELVLDSLTGGAFPVYGNYSSAKVAALYAAEGSGAVRALSAAQDQAYFAGIAWVGTVPAGTNELFRFKLWMLPWAGGAQFDLDADFYLCGDHFDKLSSGWIEVQLPEPVTASYVPTDTTVNAWDAGANFGDGLTFSVRQKGVMDALLHFDLWDIPQLATVDSAMLKLYPTYRTNGAALHLGVYPLMGEWSADDVTWNTAPEAADTAAAMMMLSAVDGAVEIDITALVQQWVDGSLANNGLALSGDGDTSVEYFFMATEFGGMWPVLEVTYQ